MTEQSPNDLFHASSFMQGHNAEYLEQLYARYASDPNAVDEAWASFFRQMGDDDVSVKRELSPSINPRLVLLLPDYRDWSSLRYSYAVEDLPHSLVFFRC